jgi:hypothetical protein
MAVYMTQTMSSGILTAIQYYRKSSDHPSHKESSQFTVDAKATYAAANNILPVVVVEGNYRSGQGKPANPDAVEI